MKVSRIKFLNVMGITELDVKLDGHWNEISGDNGVGKTSFIEGLKSIGIKGKCASLLRQGTEKGEIVYVLDDGTEIIKEIGTDKSSAVMKHAELGNIRNQGAIQGLVDALAINPVEFLTADQDKRVDLLLKAIPMTLSAEDLGFVPVALLQSVDLSKHALPVIGQLYKTIYDNRRDLNRDGDSKRTTAQETAATLPADSPTGDWSDVYDQKSKELGALKLEAQNKVAEIRADYKSIEDTETLICHEKEIQLEKQLSEAIEKLRADTDIAKNTAKEIRDAQIREAAKNRDESLQYERNQYEPKNNELVAAISQAKTMIEQHAKAETTRQYIAKLNDEAAAIEGKSKRLTEMLSRLDVLKASKLSKLPIPGLEVREGEIFLNGLPYDSVNDARRIRLALEIAIIRAKAAKINLVCIDGLEKFSRKTLAAFRKQADEIAPDLQFVLSRVSEGPLVIATEEGAA